MISPSYSASTCAGHIISLNFLNNSREYYYSSFTLEDARTTELKNLPHRWPACKVSPAWLDSDTNPQRQRSAERRAGGVPGSLTWAHTSASTCAIRSLRAASWNCSSLFRISFPISVEWKREKNHIYPQTVSWLSFSSLSSYLLELSKKEILWGEFQSLKTQWKR